jgi:hypothetical protein
VKAIRAERELQRRLLLLDVLLEDRERGAPPQLIMQYDLDHKTGLRR